MALFAVEERQRAKRDHLEPGRYLTDGQRLLLVVSVIDAEHVLVEDVGTGSVVWHDTEELFRERPLYLVTPQSAGS